MTPNRSFWLIPPEYGKFERLIEETGILPVFRGREQHSCPVVTRFEIRFKAPKETRES
jgi:hypothetical protein